MGLPSAHHVAGQAPRVDSRDLKVPCGLDHPSSSCCLHARKARRCARAEAEAMQASHARAQKVTVPELEGKLLAAGGPQTQATRPSYVKFHDDKARPAPAKPW